jgi:hypothetical protein
MTAGKWVIAAALAVGLLPRVAAAEYWRYETDSGSTAFTDDAKNIPTKYRAGAVKIAEESLFTYKRLSLVEPIQPTPHSVAPTAEPVAPPQREAPATGRLVFDVEGIPMELESNGEPIRIERRSNMHADGEYTQYGPGSTTIVRQGDKPLIYIDER